MTKNSLSDRDYEQICAYLDNEMAQDERRRFMLRLQKDTELQKALEAIRRTRLILRSQPLMRAPRNYTLSLQLAEKKRRHFGFEWITKPLLQTASALGSILFTLFFLYNLVAFQTSLYRGPMAAAPVQPEESIMQMAVPTQEAGDQQPLLLAPTPYPGEQPMAKSAPEEKAPTESLPYPFAGEIGGMGGGEETGAPAIAEAPLM